MADRFGRFQCLGQRECRRGLAGVGKVDRDQSAVFDQSREKVLGLRDAEAVGAEADLLERRDAEPPHGAHDAQHLVLVLGQLLRRRVGGKHPLRQVPQPFLADPAGDDDVQADAHELEHPRRVLAVRPAGRNPTDLHLGVVDLARLKRPFRAQLVEDRLAELRVAGDEVARTLAPVAPARRPDLGEIAELGQALDRDDEGVVLEGPPVRDRLVHERPVEVAEPAPQHQVLGALDGPGGIDLDAVEMTRDLDD